MGETLQYQDLLQVQYQLRGADPATGLDCLGVVAEVFRRAGVEVPRGALSAGGDQVEGLLDAVGEDDSPWLLVGTELCAATRALDVLYCDAPAVRPHVAVVVDPGRRIALTATEGQGVHGVRIGRLSSVQAVYRLKPTGGERPTGALAELGARGSQPPVSPEVPA